MVGQVIQFLLRLLVLTEVQNKTDDLLIHLNGGEQHWNAAAVLSDKFLFKGSTGAEGAYFLEGFFIQPVEFRRSDCTESQKVVAGIPERFQKGVVGAGHDAILVGESNADQVRVEEAAQCCVEFVLTRSV